MYKRPIQPLPEGFLDQFEKKLAVKRDSVELDESSSFNRKELEAGNITIVKDKNGYLYLNNKSKGSAMGPYHNDQQVKTAIMKIQKESVDLDEASCKKSMKEDQLDPVDKKAVKKDFDDRKDQDIDNDGDVDSSDKYLHKRRKAISKAIAKEEVELGESHFKVGDEVVCKASGMEGEVVAVGDEEEEEKYYTVKREDGKTMKYAPNELELEDEEEEDDEEMEEGYYRGQRKTATKKQKGMKTLAQIAADRKKSQDEKQVKEAFEVQTSKTIDDSGEDKAISYGRKKGYKEAGVIGDSPVKYMVLFNLRPEDKAHLRGANVKSGEKVFRYATRQTVAGDIFPLIKVNLNKGMMYFLTQESSSGETDQVKFKTRGVKLKFARMLSGVVEQFDLDEATDFRKGDQVKNAKTGEKGTVLHKGNRDEVMVKFGSLNKSLPASQLRLLDEFYDTGSAEEVHMAMRQLEFIAYACDEISDYLEMRGDMDEWFQNKLAAVHDRMMGLHAYIEGDKRMQGGYDAYGESHIPYYGEEEVELDEKMQDTWTVELPKLKKKVPVRARNSTEALKKAAKRAGVDWRTVKVGKVQKEEVELDEGMGQYTHYIIKDSSGKVKHHEVVGDESGNSEMEHRSYLRKSVMKSGDKLVSFDMNTKSKKDALKHKIAVSMKEEVEQVDESQYTMAGELARRAHEKQKKKDAEERLKAKGWVRNNRGGWSKPTKEEVELDEVYIEESLPPHLKALLDKNGNIDPKKVRKNVKVRGRSKITDVTPKGYGPKKAGELDEKMTADQKKTAKSLIRLGDKPRQAVKTAKKEKPKDKEFYRKAYESTDLEEKSVSQAQQKLMGMALAYKRGEMDDASDEVKKLADSMSEKDLEDFAKTKHKGLPVTKEKYLAAAYKKMKERTGY